MIVLGADMHKSSHTLAAVVASTGKLRGDKTIDVGAGGVAAALDWARSLGDERVWALEDRRHVSGAFERFLLGCGERVVRVATKLMAQQRRGGRKRGKSDLIDAIAVARAALREGLDRLPVADAWRAPSRRQPPDQHRDPPHRHHPRALPPETRDYIARKRAEGKTHREALRCLKRHLTRRIWHLLQPPTQSENLSISGHRSSESESGGS